MIESRIAGALLAAAFMVSAVVLGPNTTRAQDLENVQLNEERMDEPPELAMARAIPHLQALTEANVGIWGQDKAAWSVDLESGVIEFTNDRDWRISAPVQVIGTYDTRDGSFMWGWDHPSVPETSAGAAKAVRQYGERNGIDKTTSRLVEISEDEAWQFTGLAAYLTDGQGAYRGPVGTTLVFMTFGTVTISKP